MARQQWRRHAAVATLGVACAAAAVVAVAADDGPTRNSTAAAISPGAPAHPGNDGKAYHHVWPVKRAQPTFISFDCLACFGLARFCNVYMPFFFLNY